MPTAGVGKLLMIVGIFSLLSVFVAMQAVNTGLCADILNGGGCRYDYSTFIVPALVGISLLTIGALAYWWPKPRKTWGF